MTKTKLIALAMSVMMALCLLAACGGGSSATQAPQQDAVPPTDAPEPAPTLPPDATDEPDAGVENPMVQVETIDEILEQTGMTMVLPEGAEGAMLYIIDIGDGREVAEADFFIDGVDYTLRMMKAEAMEDISGMNFEWTVTKDMTFEDYPYTIYYNEGAEGVSLWYDQLSGVTYSAAMNSGADEAALEAISLALIPAG